MKGIINGQIILENGIVSGKVLLFDEKVIDIVDEKEIDKVEIEEIIDAKGNYVSPGLIDIHIHGSGGKDTMDGSIEDIKIISETIVKNGTTAFLPTTMTMSEDNIKIALNNIRVMMKDKTKGAKILGAHMEGPFINKDYKGAQNEKYIMKPNYELVEEFKDVIKIITMAPENDENNEFIKRIKNDFNIVLSIGHSNATYEEAMEGISNGIAHATHTFNAMTPLHHRKPGAVGAIFNSDVSCELIADKIHVHSALFQTLANVKGKDKLVLITDSMKAGCMEDGIYDLGGQTVVVKNNSARLEDGTLAGSVLTLNKAVKNIFENTNLKLEESIKLASLNPAKVIGIDDKKGSIEKGKDADIVIFDNEFNVLITICEGEKKYVL